MTSTCASFLQPSHCRRSSPFVQGFLWNCKGPCNQKNPYLQMFFPCCQRIPKVETGEERFLGKSSGSFGLPRTFSLVECFSRIHCKESNTAEERFTVPWIHWRKHLSLDGSYQCEDYERRLWSRAYVVMSDKSQTSFHFEVWNWRFPLRIFSDKFGPKVRKLVFPTRPVSAHRFLSFRCKAGPSLHYGSSTNGNKIKARCEMYLKQCTD